MNPSELLEVVPDQPKKEKCKCKYQTYKVWSEYSKEDFPSLESLGDLDNDLPPSEVGTLPYPGYNYWEEKYPISLEHYPQAYGEILRCSSCNATFISYLEVSGHSPQKRIRWIQPDLYPQD